ncbi:MAG: inositol monophosphatase family protein [Corynebacterium sp.]|nr:inositol monophosphatase family protein [Corynebacterium sp.]
MNAEYLQALPALAKTFALSFEGADDARLAQALVFNAGRHAWRLRELGVSTQQKTSVSDVVTEADIAVESFVTHVLELLRPDDGIVAEEGNHRSSNSGRTWVIDPIDGTYNYAAGSDYWCSALALVEGEKPIVSAVHRPAMGYTWVGGRELGTKKDDQVLPRLSDTPLSQTCVATYLHPSFLPQESHFVPWQRAASQAATIRMLGAGSVDLASVADGTVGAWFQHSVPDWDWLPGRCLIEGVGGVATQVEARGVIWSVAGNSQAVAELTELLQND